MGGVLILLKLKLQKYTYDLQLLQHCHDGTLYF